jgi:hypothetical protein
MHKIYISYDETNDQEYRDRLEALCYDKACISRSPTLRIIGDASDTEELCLRVRNEQLKDSSVTIVLIGKDTWKRKIIDWEILSSLHDSDIHSRNGLLGIVLPTYVRKDLEMYNPLTIPKRLYHNLACNYAKICTWTNNVSLLNGLIEDACVSRYTRNPNNTSPPYACDLS